MNQVQVFTLYNVQCSTSSSKMFIIKWRESSVYFVQCTLYFVNQVCTFYESSLYFVNQVCTLYKYSSYKSFDFHNQVGIDFVN